MSLLMVIKRKYIFSRKLVKKDSTGCPSGTDSKYPTPRAKFLRLKNNTLSKRHDYFSCLFFSSWRLDIEPLNHVNNGDRN